MPEGHALTVRLPSGTEYWYAQEVPEAGDFVSRLGTRYVVVSREPADEQQTVVTLAEESAPAGEVAAGALT
jgi:hypothetical protein